MSIHYWFLQCYIQFIWCSTVTDNNLVAEFLLGNNSYWLLKIAIAAFVWIDYRKMQYS
jgi:hypothetical protein